MSAPIDISGQRFGRLLAISPTDKRKHGKVVWLCECECGKNTLVPAGALRSGNTTSCGGHSVRTYPPSSYPGEKHFLLTAVRPVGTRKKHCVEWEFECECGGSIITPPHLVRSGRNKSCGCLYEKAKKAPLSENCTALRHSHARRGQMSSTYSSWTAMKQRCLNPNQTSYPRYGGIGITVCDRWMNFDEFLEDMGERPDWADGGIDRIDVTGNYEPGNCRWATREQQQQNKRSRTTKAPSEEGA